jgi:putative ABC transport system permease protein
VDDATLLGVPPLRGHVSPAVLRDPDAVVVDPGGTEGKLETTLLPRDRGPYGGPHLNVPTRSLEDRDELLVNDHRVVVKGLAEALPRFPPRPLLYTTFSNAGRILLPERHRLTFVLASTAPGLTARDLAVRIAARTGLKARAAADFKADTVRWFLVTSEDVGDIAAMLTLAMCLSVLVSWASCSICSQPRISSNTPC